MVLHAACAACTTVLPRTILCLPEEGSGGREGERDDFVHLFSSTAYGSCSATALVWMWQPMSLTSSWGAGGMGKDLATS